MEEDAFADLLEAARQQAASPHTPYVGETYRRLLDLGISEADALEQIAICLGDEMADMALRRRTFDQKAYRTALAALPAEELSDAVPRDE